MKRVIMVLMVLMALCVVGSFAQEVPADSTAPSFTMETSVPTNIWYTIQIYDTLRAMLWSLLFISICAAIVWLMFKTVTPLDTDDYGPTIYCYASSLKLGQTFVKKAPIWIFTCLTICVVGVIFIPAKDVIVGQLVTSQLPAIGSDVKSAVDYIFEKINSLK